MEVDVHPLRKIDCCPPIHINFQFSVETSSPFPPKDWEIDGWTTAGGRLTYGIMGDADDPMTILPDD